MLSEISLGQNAQESKVKAFIPMYQPLEVTKCKKCGKIIAEPRELIRTVTGLQTPS